MDCTIEEEEDILKSPKKSNGEIMQWPYDHHGYCKISGAAIGSPYCESLFFSGCRGGHRIILLSEIDMLLTSMVSLKMLTSQFFIFFIYLFFFGAYSFNALSAKFASVEDLPNSEQPSGSRRVALRAAS